MEKILNFYITFVGGFWIARGENFFLRMCRPNISKSILNTNITDISEKSLHYYGSLLYHYGKNIFYYKYVYENVRSGKQRFYLPYKTENKNIYSNIQILKLFNQHFLAVIFQDINIKDLRIYTKNKKIIYLFKEMFGASISDLVKKDDIGFLQYIYGGIGELCNITNLPKILSKELSSKDLYHIKENIYNLDFWLINDCVSELLIQKDSFIKEYNYTVILGILSTIRETLLGFFLFIKVAEIQQKETKKDYHISYLKKLYFDEILNLSSSIETKNILTKIIEKIYDKFDELLTNIIHLDDNLDFLTLGHESWLLLWDKKPEKDIDKKLSGEDVVWFRGFLKNITYYNKRFLIPR